MENHELRIHKLYPENLMEMTSLFHELIRRELTGVIHYEWEKQYDSGEGQTYEGADEISALSFIFWMRERVP